MMKGVRFFSKVAPAKRAVDVNEVLSDGIKHLEQGLKGLAAIHETTRAGGTVLTKEFQEVSSDFKYAKRLAEQALNEISNSSTPTNSR